MQLACCAMDGSRYDSSPVTDWNRRSKGRLRKRVWVVGRVPAQCMVLCHEREQESHTNDEAGAHSAQLWPASSLAACMLDWTDASVVTRGDMTRLTRVTHPGAAQLISRSAFQGAGACGTQSNSRWTTICHRRTRPTRPRPITTRSHPPTALYSPPVAVVSAPLPIPQPRPTFRPF